MFRYDEVSVDAVNISVCTPVWVEFSKTIFDRKRVDKRVLHFEFIYFLFIMVPYFADLLNIKTIVDDMEILLVVFHVIFAVYFVTVDFVM